MCSVQDLLFGIFRKKLLFGILVTGKNSDLCSVQDLLFGILWVLSICYSVISDIQYLRRISKRIRL